MPSASYSLVNYLRAVSGAWRNDPRDDAELLSRFADGGDEVAFQVLVCRHGLLVWQSCVRVLGNSPDAEDAFQATFLALTRKAKRLRREPLAGWLYRVARRTALKAEAGVRRRREVEQQVKPAVRSDIADASQKELYAVLDLEMGNLPEKLRVPLLLHYLEGKTQAEVAHIVGCARSIAQKRLEQGERLLRERLERRGVTLGAVSMAALLGNTTGASTVPTCLIENTARAAVAFRAGTLTGVTADAAQKLLRSLAVQGTVRASWWLMLACVGLLGVGGAGLVVWKMCMGVSDIARPETLGLSTTPKPAVPAVIAKPSDKRVDCFGDPLPEGALARIGTIRFRPGLWNDNPRNAVVFLPDCKTLVSVHGTNCVHFWETATGRELRRLEGPSECYNVALSADGKKLAVVGGKEVWAWNLSADPPQRLLCYKVPDGKDSKLSFGRSAAAFAPDNKTLAVAIPGEATLLFDVNTGNLQQELWNTDNDNVWMEYLAFSSDGKTLVVGDTLWDMATRTKRLVLKMESRKTSISDGLILQSLAFSPDDKMLVTEEVFWKKPREKKNSLSLWNVTTGDRIYQIDLNTCDERRFVTFLPDGQTLLETDGSNICFRDASTGKLKSLTNITCSDPVVCGGAWSTCLSPDGKLLARIGRGEVGVWEVATGKRIGVELNEGIQNSVKSLAFSPDGKHLVTLECLADGSGNRSKLRLWNAVTGRLDRKLEDVEDHCLLDRVDSYINYPNDRHIDVLAFEVQPPFNASWLSWDIQTGKTSNVTAVPLIEKSPNSPAYTLNTHFPNAASSDGRWQVLGSRDGSIVVMDHPAKKIVCRFTVAPDRVTHVAVSDNGGVILSVSEIERRVQIAVWSTTTGEQLMKIEEEFEIAHLPPPVTLSPDGRRIASVLKEKPNTIRIWEIVSETVWGEYKASGKVHTLAWSSDGRFLASSDEKANIQLWDVMSGQSVRRFPGHRARVTSMAYSSDGLRLASGSDDTTALIWDLRGLPYQEAKTSDLPPSDVLWAALQKDAGEAWRTMRLLTQNPDVALPLLSERLRPSLHADSKRVETLLAQLDDDEFKIRNQAVQQLMEMDQEIEPILLKALTKKPSVQVNWLINEVLRKVFHSPKRLQVCRGMEVLERIGTPAARQVLEELSRLPEGYVQAGEAKAALRRSSKQVPASVP